MVHFIVLFNEIWDMREEAGLVIKTIQIIEFKVLLGHPSSIFTVVHSQFESQEVLFSQKIILFHVKI